LILDVPAYFCLLPYFKAIFSLPKYARKSNTSPAALGEGLARQLLLFLDGKRERDRDTVNASDISRSCRCKMPLETSHGAFKKATVRV